MMKTRQVWMATTESWGVFVGKFRNDFLERVVQFCLKDTECQTL